jgi:hypothetical protein
MCVIVKCLVNVSHTLVSILSFIYLYLAVVGFEFRASPLLGKCSVI